MAAAQYRFRPRYRSFPYTVAAVGVLIALCVPLFGLEGASRTFAFACGVAGPVLAVLYLASPAWRLVVVVDEEALEIRRKGEVRLRLPWSEIEQVICAPDSKTAYVSGGTPERSLLLPGPGAPGPYRIEGREDLYDYIMARVDEGRIREVPSLESCVPK